MPNWLDALSDDEFNGKVAMVTGASSGIGEACALEMAKRKARVLMLVRSVEKGEAACQRIREAYPAADLHLEVADLSLVKSVAEFCKGFNERIDILVNNAGVFGAPYGRTAEGVETVLASNHLGHFVLTCQLLSRGLLSPGARLILVTGAVYTRGSRQVTDWDDWTEETYHKMKAYSNSKLAVCLFGLWLRSAVKSLLTSSARVFIVHPGIVNTRISRHVEQRFLAPCRCCLRCCMWTFMQTPFRGCQGILLCAADHGNDRISGAYFNNCQQEPWDRAILNNDLVMLCWDFSFQLVQRVTQDEGLLNSLKAMRNAPRDTLSNLP